MRSGPYDMSRRPIENLQTSLQARLPRYRGARGRATSNASLADLGQVVGRRFLSNSKESRQKEGRPRKDPPREHDGELRRRSAPGKEARPPVMCRLAQAWVGASE